MVFVQIWDAEPTGSVIFLVSGHSSSANGDKERYQVCAAASALIVCMHAYYAKGEPQPQDGDGHALVTVPPEGRGVARFVAFSLQKIAESYEGHLIIENTSANLCE
jgi:uncharacterized protein YsxB (DUF464 family)